MKHRLGMTKKDKAIIDEFLDALWDAKSMSMRIHNTKELYSAICALVLDAGVDEDNLDC